MKENRSSKNNLSNVIHATGRLDMLQGVIICIQVARCWPPHSRGNVDV